MTKYVKLDDVKILLNDITKIRWWLDENFITINMVKTLLELDKLTSMEIKDNNKTTCSKCPVVK